MSRLFPFLSARPHSAYAIPLTPTKALALSADAQHRRPAPLSALACPSHQGTTNHVQVTRPRRLYTILSSPLCLPPYRSVTTYAYPLRLYLAHISDHYSHRSLHNRPPFSIEYLSLYPSYLLLVSLPHTSSHFRYLSLSSPIFSYTASLSTTPPYALSFPFLSLSFPSHSYWLYHYIFILAFTHPLIHPSSHWLAIVLLPFPRSSERSSRSYWSIARLSLLYESDSIGTSSCIYTYHE